MFIDDRVVIQIDRDRLSIIPGYIVICCIFPPLVERTVVTGLEYLIVESQTETGAA